MCAVRLIGRYAHWAIEITAASVTDWRDVVSFLRNFFSRLLWKPAFGLLAAVGVTAIWALYLFVHDDADFATSRARHLASMSERQAIAADAVREAAGHVETLDAEIAKLHERRDRASRILETLHSMQSGWGKFFGNREQQRINGRRIEDLEKRRRDDEKVLHKLERERARAEATRERVVRQLKRAEARLGFAQRNDWPAAFYASIAWQSARGYIIAGLCVYFFGPLVVRFVFFYVFAPRVARGNPVRLNPTMSAFPWVGESETTVSTSLWPGEVAKVRRKFLHTSEDGAMRRTRALLDWRWPLMSLASGLFNLVELRNGTAGAQFHLTFSRRRKPHAQLTLAQIPDGGALVVRPSYIAAIVHEADRAPKIRRRWQLFRWQSWITGQFCYFEIGGPCRLVLAGRPALETERLTETEANPAPARRAGRRATVGFTPNLEYGLVRTGRFWDYYRAENSLFDAYLAGVGCVVLQSPVQTEPQNGAMSALASGKDRIRKLVGL